MIDNNANSNAWQLAETSELALVDGGFGVKEGGCVPPDFLGLLLKTIGQVPMGGRN
jgi:hypothetical protein